MSAQSFWLSCGYQHLKRNDHGWLRVTPDWLRLVLARPELALLEESGPNERALHERLNLDPTRAVSSAELDAVEDADTRENYQHFLHFRRRLLDAVTLERFYLQCFKPGSAPTARDVASIDFPPVFLDLVVQAIVRGLLEGTDDPFLARAGELFFRRQRIATEGGQVLSADAETIQHYADTGGFGNVGRLLAQQGTPLRGMSMDVLSHENAQLYWLADDRFKYVLELSPQSAGTLALARLLERWLKHFVGAEANIEPRAKIEDEKWRWHLGLDADASAILNALYEGVAVDESRLASLVALFSLDLADQSRVREDVRGHRIHLAMAVDDERVMKMKPQNLLLNLPLIEMH